MATARVLPEAQVEVIISPTGTVTTPDIGLPVGGSFYFYNNAPFPVQISFTSTFNTINLAAGASSSPITAPGSANFTVNYGIRNNNNNQVTGGPYGIQFGNGPMAITIQGGDSTPGTISIPNGGSVQFTSDAKYNINWSQTGIFSITELVQGVNPVATAQSLPASTSVNYTLSPRLQGTRGGGTVKINS
jgi:hypothetical protein